MIPKPSDDTKGEMNYREVLSNGQLGDPTPFIGEGGFSELKNSSGSI